MFWIGDGNGVVEGVSVVHDNLFVWSLTIHILGGALRSVRIGLRRAVAISKCNSVIVLYR